MIIDIKDKTVWLYRNNSHSFSWDLIGCKYGFENMSRDIGYVTIGCWSDLYDYSEYMRINDLEQSKRKGEHNKAFKRMMDTTGRTNLCTYLYYFLYEMNIGDYLLIPSGGYFCIYEIKSNIFHSSENLDASIVSDVYNNDFASEFSHRLYYRKVQRVTDRIKRKDYVTGTLSSSLKYQGTVLQLSENAKEHLQLSLQLASENKPVSLSGILSGTLGKDIFKQLEGSLSIALNSDSFEELLSDLFYRLGADTSIVLPKNPRGKSGDEDCDVEAVFETLKVKVWAQLKWYENYANLDDAVNQIRKYYDIHKEEDVNKGYTILLWIVTTSSDTNKNQYVNSSEGVPIRIIDGTELTEILLNEGIKNL